MISVAFFNSQGGVGTTSLVYHSAWMFAELGARVLIVDADPQSHLSIMALDPTTLETLWSDGDSPRTLYGAVAPVFSGTGSIRPAHIEPLTNGLGLVAGDLALSRTEDDLSAEWPRRLDGSQRAFHVTTAFWRVIREAAQRHEADLVLIDAGPNLGAINRAALMASNHVVVPVAPDLLSLHALRNLGPTLREWRDTWRKALPLASPAWGEMPPGGMMPVGYVLMQHAERLGRPMKAPNWRERLIMTYCQSVLGQTAGVPSPDPNQIGIVRHYRSLMPLATEARKPMFKLTSADGAIGALQANVQQCRGDFENLCYEIARKVGYPM
ncbi:MAG: ParA family protein [Bryobacterales bacterium]|nr:ParA family protein [Bryobacterales bacterium]